MARGFLAGAIWGVVVSAVGAGALSVAMGPPERKIAPVAPVTEAPLPGTEDADAGDGVSEAAPDADAPVSEPVPEETGGEDMVAEEAAPELESEDSVALSDPAPAPAPIAPSETDTVLKPEAPAGMAEAEAEPDPALPEADNTPPQAATELDTPDAPDAPADAVPVAGAETSDSPQRADSAQPDSPAQEAAPEVETSSAEPPLPAPFGEPDEAASGEPMPDAAPESGAAPKPQVTQAEDAGEDGQRPGVGTPAGSLIGRDAVPTGRLPSIASAAPEGEAATAEGDGTPLERFAADPGVVPDGPRMAIVLIDDGSGPLGPDTVGEFPFPVSFALTPSHPDAAATAAAYRAGGFEVLTMAGVPEGARATDVEVSLEGALGAVPEAIGVLEDPDRGLQASRAVSEQAAQFLQASGHGLVMLPKGLNTGQALAQREGVPAVTVFRDFDGEGQDPRVMRRFLDQAAFKARQEGAVVMLGRLRADTVSALLLWGLQDRASSVALVPVSLVLQESVAAE
ncbi:divergent polysaccharide deacetylase family protein [Salipiger abyssi]|uniref:divergent polysaccharide deacetylase family protein n=1 Tax=Salipiger abyssi TaxID=1250539 RepID=UPI001A8EB03E|nr:divergent polysaccharide deacetylase family protein [Salipiger abyssi]MBN9886377.1 divergent polysaccharide deacetylase family protein [Salipiger abyssi]